MVIFSSLDQTRASIQSLYPQSMCHLLPVVQLSDHLHMCKAASLVWIDLPRRHFRLENLRNVFQRLTEAIDPRSVATVITMTNVNNRFSRTSEVAQALQPFHRSTHCPCRYREPLHGSVDIYIYILDTLSHGHRHARDRLPSMCHTPGVKRFGVGLCANGFRLGKVPTATLCPMIQRMFRPGKPISIRLVLARAMRVQVPMFSPILLIRLMSL